MDYDFLALLARVAVLAGIVAFIAALWAIL